MRQPDDEGAARAPIDELVSVGPIRVQVQLPEGLRAQRVRRLVSGKALISRIQNGWIRFERASVLDHEVIVID